MSRVGNNPISIPDDVSIKVNGNNIEVSGKKGKHLLNVHDNIKTSYKDGVLSLIELITVLLVDQCCTTRQIVCNMIKGNRGLYKRT